MFCPTNFFSNQIEIHQFEKRSVGQNMNIGINTPPPPINVLVTALVYWRVCLNHLRTLIQPKRWYNKVRPTKMCPIKVFIASALVTAMQGRSQSGQIGNNRQFVSNLYI